MKYIYLLVFVSTYLLSSEYGTARNAQFYMEVLKENTLNTVNSRKDAILEKHEKLQKDVILLKSKLTKKQQINVELEELLKEELTTIQRNKILKLKKSNNANIKKLTLQKKAKESELKIINKWIKK